MEKQTRHTISVKKDIFTSLRHIATELEMGQGVRVTHNDIVGFMIKVGLQRYDQPHGFRMDKLAEDIQEYKNDG